jgi:hypothetical protein
MENLDKIDIIKKTFKGLMLRHLQDLNPEAKEDNNTIRSISQKLIEKNYSCFDNIIIPQQYDSRIERIIKTLILNQVFYKFPHIDTSTNIIEFQKHIFDIQNKNLDFNKYMLSHLRLIQFNEEEYLSGIALLNEIEDASTIILTDENNPSFTNDINKYGKYIVNQIESIIRTRIIRNKNTIICMSDENLKKYEIYNITKNENFKTMKDIKFKEIVEVTSSKTYEEKINTMY